MERSGLGFTVMESFMDSVEVVSQKDEGTTITMVRELHGASK
jgi:stage II sporulation protein AB (anti-sigma F factor)